MNELTSGFLEAVAARNATSVTYCRETEVKLLGFIGDGIKEAFDLLLMFDAVELAEEDRGLVATLGEYSSKLGAFGRVGQELRGKVQELARIRFEIEQLETRLGGPTLDKLATLVVSQAVAAQAPAPGVGSRP